MNNINDLKNGKSKNTHKTKRVARSIWNIFRPEMHNKTRKMHPEEYYCNYYFNKNVSDSVEVVSKIENSTKKAAATMLMELGLSQNAVNAAPNSRYEKVVDLHLIFFYSFTFQLRSG